MRTIENFTTDETMRNVLDRGVVRLVDFMGGDVSVVRAARVSYDAAWRAGEDEGSDSRLINYLMRHRHDTPFEAVTLTFEIKAPIFVFRQWHRHRTQSYNELSARYKELPEEFYLPDPKIIGQQSKHNKQVRDIDIMSVEEYNLRVLEIEALKEACENDFKLYKRLLNSGWPRELARMKLPVNTYSHMFTTMNLRNLFHFLSLRCDPHAQWEIREYANRMLELTRLVAPVCVQAWETYKQPKEKE